MKKIFLIRHGESEWNVLKKIQGQQDVPLTKKGIYQAKLVADKLVDENIDAIFSSDLCRAKDTAKVIGKKINVKVNTRKELREINFGFWEGMSIEDLSNKYYNDLMLWRKEPEKLKIKGIESLEELQARTMDSVNNIINTETWENLAIVSHSAALKTIILGILDMNLTYFKNLTLGNVSLTTIELRDYNRVLKTLNDTHHTEEDKKYER